MKKFRHELKYYINENDYLWLRSKIGLILSKDKHSVDEEGYLIRSLYFDNIHDQDLLEKNYGIFRRKKFRIRTYNHSDEVIRLEKKSRQGEYVQKTSALITKEEYEKLLDWDYAFLAAKQEQVFRDFYLFLNSEYMRPRVIVDYVREAYVSPLGNVRITFDKELSYAANTIDLFDADFSRIEVLDQPRTIMEVKFDEFLPDHIRQILQLDAHNRSAISKYMICRIASTVYHGY